MGVTGIDISRRRVRTVMEAGGRARASDSDGVLVVSVWRRGDGGFLGRITMTTTDPDTGREETAVSVVDSPDNLLDSVRDWLTSLTGA
jgi:hypothetical protein